MSYGQRSEYIKIYYFHLEILGGTPVFKGTRVPVSILFDYLKGGDSLQDFLENYPTVKKSMAKKVIELSAENLLKQTSQNETAA